MTLTVRLPWPHKDLWPNRYSRMYAHWRTRAAAAKSARAEAKFLCTVEMGARWHIFPKDTYLPVCYTFCPPTKRVYDRGGAYGAMKPAEDGIADALEIDDRWFDPVTLRRGPVVKGGEVIVTIGE